MRIALCVEYDGTGYSGWQIQDHSPSVQAVIERALSAIADHPVQVMAAGRTDTGVHALGQVVHFDTHAERPQRAWLRGANTHLPRDVRIIDARPVSDDFHARHSALARHYRYLILNRPQAPAVGHDRVTWEPRPLDAPRMQLAGQHWLGEHDFSAFRAAACQSRSPWRNLSRLQVSRHGQWVVIDVVANAFLHHMVRNLVGTLLEIGCGRRPPDWAAELLAARDRTRAARTAPAGGLYLAAVQYPSRFGVTAPAPLWPF
ncbi:MAG TPA: tRNA pseudouridine(38-40) synthase TruA [Gammaproteobacteria bacterium]|uniref:tRNA pseudouridine(38-40) synthase TruA n=1 Tax=Immundisolibacter sp. TaxID=1934948 RepID=UPI000E7DC9E5|nr:tRNA pseudouridine(38-40) synthase TruA [Gammaproteobacteria bacterium]HCZ49254.1 tRNA pseudouridine(38-40) synthase TruA [Gammaproteobacteria bacterium]MCH78692.1 tRNA pseudouridine(38-40) synthase TruA [Gammaproteobacteria bacterium]